MFKCSKCGVCCQNLTAKAHGFKFGMWLWPEEAKKFPDTLPYWGFGSKGKRRKRPSIIGVYQYPFERCPFLSGDNKCRIYNSRPNICRAFPLSLTSRASVSRNCSTINELIPEGKHIKLGDYFTDEVLLANKEWNIQFGQLINAHTEYWLFDLNTMQWHEATTELLESMR